MAMGSRCFVPVPSLRPPHTTHHDAAVKLLGMKPALTKVIFPYEV